MSGAAGARFWRFRKAMDEGFDSVFREIDPIGKSWDIDAYYPGWQPKSWGTPFDPTMLRNTFRPKPKRKKIPTFPHSLVPIMCPKGVWEEHVATLFDGHVLVYSCKIDEDDEVEVIVPTIVDLIDLERSKFRRDEAGNIIFFNNIVLRNPVGPTPPIFLCGHVKSLRKDPIVDHRFVDIVTANRFTGLMFAGVEVL